MTTQRRKRNRKKINNKPKKKKGGGLRFKFKHEINWNETNRTHSSTPDINEPKNLAYSEEVVRHFLILQEEVARFILLTRANVKLLLTPISLIAII